MLLEGDLAGEPPEQEIRLVESETDWDAYSRLSKLDWEHYIEQEGRLEDAGVAGPMFRSRRAKSPTARFWLAYVDGEARAYFTSWEGIGGFGQVEDLFTHPDFRHRGLATALIHRCVADCRSRGAGPVVILCDPDDTPKEMYAALGFQPVAVKRTYWKNATGPAP